MNKHLKRFFGVKNKENERDWNLILLEVETAKESTDRNSGEALFTQLLEGLNIFEFKKRAYIKKHFKKYKETF
jgi:hypothetical protein